MCSDTVIKLQAIAKCFHIYRQPQDRLKQMLTAPLGSSRSYYEEFWALSDISFSIRRGETVGIIGRNGSGKSTLLQILCGTLAPSNGEVLVGGRIAALLELGAGFNSEFSGRENIYLNAAILGLSQDQIEQAYPDILAFSELDEFIDRPVKTYSSGMYARLAFAIAIHVQPDILVVDEALAVGDSRFVAKCMRKIREIQQSGCSILFVSHDVNAVRTLCDRVIWLDHGRILADGEVFPITGRYMEMMCQDQDEELSFSETKLLAASELVNMKPVTHWGSHRGLIQSAQVCDVQGRSKDVFYWAEPIMVKVRLQLPDDFSRQDLSVAISIKDLKGSDLIVSTTHDFQATVFPDHSAIEVSFAMENCLVTGKYLLVAALENRQHRDIHYYEYIEGCHYFSSLAEQRLFGQFQPQIVQQLRSLNTKQTTSNTAPAALKRSANSAAFQPNSEEVLNEDQ